MALQSSLSTTRLQAPSLQRRSATGRASTIGLDVTGRASAAGAPAVPRTTLPGSPTSSGAQPVGSVAAPGTSPESRTGALQFSSQTVPDFARYGFKDDAEYQDRLRRGFIPGSSGVYDPTLGADRYPQISGALSQQIEGGNFTATPEMVRALTSDVSTESLGNLATGRTTPQAVALMQALGEETPSPEMAQAMSGLRDTGSTGLGERDLPGLTYGAAYNALGKLQGQQANVQAYQEANPPLGSVESSAPVGSVGADPGGQSEAVASLGLEAARRGGLMAGNRGGGFTPETTDPGRSTMQPGSALGLTTASRAGAMQSTSPSTGVPAYMNSSPAMAQVGRTAGTSALNAGAKTFTDALGLGLPFQDAAGYALQGAALGVLPAAAFSGLNQGLGRLLGYAITRPAAGRAEDARKAEAGLPAPTNENIGAFSQARQNTAKTQADLVGAQQKWGGKGAFEIMGQGLSDLFSGDDAKAAPNPGQRTTGDLAAITAAEQAKPGAWDDAFQADAQRAKGLEGMLASLLSQATGKNVTPDSAMTSPSSPGSVVSGGGSLGALESWSRSDSRGNPWSGGGGSFGGW